MPDCDWSGGVVSFPDIDFRERMMIEYLGNLVSSMSLQFLGKMGFFPYKREVSNSLELL